MNVMSLPKEENVEIGIDLGGSHVAIGVVNKDGNIIEKYEKDFTLEEKKNLINVAVKYMIDIVNSLKEKYSFSKVGIGVAGAISDGIIVKSVNLGIENFDIKKELEAKINTDVIVKNDAKCAAIAEYRFGDLKEYQNVLFLTLGTGIGGAYIYHGELMEGTKFEGFEFGHIVIKENGILCKCGKRGCFEKYGSILVFKNKVIERLNLSYEISGPELRENINNSRDKLQDIIDEYVKDLALGISNLINIFEPDCIIVGGGFARYDYLLIDQLKSEILNSNWLFNKRDNLIIKAAKLGNDAGVIGAAQIKK